MAGLKLGLKIDDAKVRAVFQRAPAAVTKRLRQLVEGGAIDVQREMRIQAPVGVGGGAGLRGSIRYAFSVASLQANIQPNVPYAGDVESGTGPHRVSAHEGTPLYKWAKLKGLNPDAVARGIARKGTKAHPYVLPTYNKMKPKIERDFAEGMLALAREIDNGL